MSESAVPSTREELEACWQRNEAELNRIHVAPSLDREMLANRVEALLAGQDAIEFALRTDSGDGLLADFAALCSVRTKVREDAHHEPDDEIKCLS